MGRQFGQMLTSNPLMLQMMGGQNFMNQAGNNSSNEDQEDFYYGVLCLTTHYI